MLADPIEVATAMSIAESIRSAIAAKLAITCPPYHVKVMEDLGDVTVQIFDTRESGGPYREGKYVAGHTMSNWHDLRLDEKTSEAAAAMLPAFSYTTEGNLGKT